MKEKIKYAGAMLICFIAVLFIRMPVMADDGVPATAWRDNAAADFAGGSGTEADPYQSTDGAQIAKIAKDNCPISLLFNANITMDAALV